MGKLESEIGKKAEPKTGGGGIATDFDSRFKDIEATEG